MIFYVYMWLREDGSPYYVGKGHGKRAFDRARMFRPRSVDRVQIVQDNLTENSAFELEKKLIVQYGRKNLGTGILHNQTDGGEGSGGHTLTAKQRKVRSAIAKNQSAEVRARISASLKGRQFSAETISKMCRAAQNRPESYNLKMSVVKKSTMTDATRNKIKNGLTGKPKSESHRAALKKAWETRIRVKSLSPEHAAALQKATSAYWRSAIRISCPYCGRLVVERFYYKWHGDNCKRRQA